MPNAKVTLVIPCLNEEHGLKELFKKLPKQITNVIVVDGNSTDKSVQVAQKNGAEVIVEKKRGYGLALRTGYNAARTELIMTCDADGTYPVERIPEMIEHFNKNKLDFLIGCRFPLMNLAVMTVPNFFGNLLISSFTSLFYRRQVTDVCSGMIMMKKKVWDKLEPRINDNKWFFSNEIKIEALKDTKITYGEFKIDLAERQGETKVGNVWIIGLEVLVKTYLKKFS
jgi:glycosyltransferase involved in cell wall biosynthesis